MKKRNLIMISFLVLLTCLNYFIFSPLLVALPIDADPDNPGGGGGGGGGSPRTVTASCYGNWSETLTVGVPPVSYSLTINHQCVGGPVSCTGPTCDEPHNGDCTEGAWCYCYSTPPSSNWAYCIWNP